VNMSDIFFKQLDIPAPDVNLEVGSGTHAVQTAQIMTRFETCILERRPDLVLVYGDVNSTVAASLVCAKLLVPVGHVEAGLRSGDRTMPEEINRLMTDQLSNILFTPSQDGNENLMREGISEHKIYLIGNVMIDTLVRLLPYTDVLQPDHVPERYALVTLHRPSNVDDPTMLHKIMSALIEISQTIPVVFPIHPRTRAQLDTLTIKLPDDNQLRLIQPVGYLEFLALQKRASVVITDSGGIQEETTYLGIPCITVRKNTERPITITMGTNVLVGQDMQRLRNEVSNALSSRNHKAQIPPLWDGKASERIADIVAAL
jgi:UDP-N-acetylglucosamine 2-epimerase (non-hydrolysing)